MSFFRNWQQKLAGIKTFFSAKGRNTKTISFNTKITHRKLRIPDTPHKITHLQQQHSTEDMLVD